jgi:hypothetical protein
VEHARAVGTAVGRADRPQGRDLAPGRPRALLCTLVPASIDLVEKFTRTGADTLMYEFTVDDTRMDAA